MEIAHRSDGLVQFKGLRKIERYAQVVGHELAHAVRMLENPEYAGLCAEMERETAEFLLSRRGANKAAVYDEETLQRLRRVQSLSARIEKPAEETEMAIWRELLAGHQAKKRSPNVPWKMAGR